MVNKVTSAGFRVADRRPESPSVCNQHAKYEPAVLIE